MNDYYVETSSPAVAAADTDTVLTLSDLADPGRSYEVDTEIVESLLAGNPSPVPGFEWTPFPFLLTIASGRVLRAEQLWVP